MNIPLLGSHGQDRELDNSQALTQNWYINKSNGKSGVVLYPTPGLTQFADIGTGPIRGAIDYNGLYFIISGNEFYEVDAAGSSVLRGTLNTSNGRCALAHNGANNGKQICIVDGTDLYIYKSDTALFSVITDSADGKYDPDCPIGATHVAFFDTFFLVNNPASSGRFNKSKGYDGYLWDGTEFATAERSPDELQGLVVSNRTLWLAGKSTAEPWYNAGAADFPFEPIQSGFSQWGTIAPYSLIEIAGMTFWLSQNDEGQGMVVATQGQTPQAISTGEIAVELSELTNLTDAYAYSYQYQQHAFYVLTFPSDEKTFVYDMAMQEWHIWASKTLGYHRSSTHTFVYGKHLVGDPITGKIYYLDWNAKTDNGDAITRIRRSQSIHGDDKEVIHDGVWIDIKEGVGTVENPDPQLQLRWRDSNGSWSSFHPRSMGKQGERNIRLIWRSLGRSFDRVYEIQTSEPVDCVLIDGYAKIRVNNREFG